MRALTLFIEKAAAGGRMLARAEGRIVLVSGAIPGERVFARIERTERGVVFADVEQVLDASADRRPAGSDSRCGGNVFAHIAYARQLALKGEIIQDAFRRIGRFPLPAAPVVTGSPEQGYRMRARLHVRGGRIGFYREGTHDLCDVATTGQLRPETSEWVGTVQRMLERKRLRGLTGIEIAENIPGDQRACHIDLLPTAVASDYTAISEGLVGLSAQRVDRPDVVRIAGSPVVTDCIQIHDAQSAALTLSRDVRAFFQGNRFLVEALVRRVVELAGSGPVIDLYAGVGLFGLSVAVAGSESVTSVEGDAVAGNDLRHNAEPFGRRVTPVHRSVESYLESARADDVTAATVIVDPPRTGIAKEAMAHLVRLQPARIIYVSCDVATLARDTRALLDAGYGMAHVGGMDLFPNTAHVETLVAFTRERQS